MYTCITDQIHTHEKTNGRHTHTLTHTHTHTHTHTWTKMDTHTRTHTVCIPIEQQVTVYNTCTVREVTHIHSHYVADGVLNSYCTYCTVEEELALLLYSSH